MVTIGEVVLEDLEENVKIRLISDMLQDDPYNKSNVDWTGRIAYADHSTYRWCAVALPEENQFPPSVNLKPICLESPKVEENRLALINTSLDEEGGELECNWLRSPAVSIAENVLEDLISSFKHMRNEMKCGKPTLIARVGKVLFRRSPLVNMEDIRTNLCTEILKQWRRSLYTNIPVSYKERIVNEVVPKIGVDFEGEKDTYQVKLSDSTRPDATLSCKCRIELNQLRNMVVDISCTTKNLDLRLMLCTKRLVTDLTDDEMQSIWDLINSAILDPDVKGGLRWPSGKDSSGDKYKVDGVWHLIANTYKNSSFRLKVRHADRFDFRTLSGEATWETSLMLKKVLSKLEEENAEASSVSEILKEDMHLIWDNFLSCERISASSGMAHIPPHKWHSKESERPLLTSELRAQRFKPYNKYNVDPTGRIAHADHSTYRWCAVALGEENQFPPSVNLKPICLDSTEPKVEENRLALINTSLDDEGGELKWNSPRSPGVSIAENVLEDLVSSFKHMRNEMKCAQLKEGRPTLLARVGKVLFLRSRLVNMEAIRTNLCTEILKQWRRLLYTNIPVSYKERIVNEVVPKIGVDFEGEKDSYQVKIELNQLRNMVVDISCTTKDLDLRLMLCTKRLVTDLTDDEMQSIRNLIDSAILDPDVNGGLRWPSGKDSSGKYKVDGVWHLIANTYKNSSFRLKVRHADRFDFRTLTGGTTWETILMLKRVVSKLQEENAEASSVSEILNEDMQLIWDNFLSCEGFLTLSCSFTMAYIPPHKRHSKEPERPLPTPELLAPQFKKNFKDKPYNKSNVEWTGKIVYADHSTSRWLTIGLDEENQFPPSVNLKPICLESTEPKVGENRLALINTSLDNGGEVKWNLPRNPGESLTENVLEDLVSSFKHVRNEMKCAKLKEVNPTLIARVGKVLFRRSPSVNMESITKNLSTETLKQLRKSFHTNIPVSYKEKIVKEVVPKVGVDFEEEKDVYQVKLSDSTRPDSTLSCKCRIELNQLRNMVVDISCTTKNLDLRLMLCTKRLVTDLTDDDMQSIRDLISLAILDPDVKGGLRWPLGKESSGDKYKVVGVWHVIANTYKNSSLRLKLLGFDVEKGPVKVTEGLSCAEISFSFNFQEENVEASSISEILKEDMQLIWDNFLSCEHFLT
ncbi:hypothetical protein DVH24_036875 [Malus domestica]|uniref:DUF7903 domain-containing protein n=1 Tax=Malus domestica TaxID=3750 RepID=A0A498IK89_MALDO|nr:hypothetical protein DVH24_036875 [Malus domestica]